MFTQAFTAAFLAVLVNSAFAADCSRQYTIKAGDICDSISKSQNVSTYQLAAINSAVVNAGCTNLIPGNSICLGTAGEDCSTTYVVVADDTCETIGAKNSVNSTILTLNNPQINSACDNIYIGEVLCTATSVLVPPAPAAGVTIVPAGPPAQATAKPAPVTIKPAAVTAPPPAPVAPVDTGSDDDCDDDDNTDAPANTDPAAPAGDDNDDDLPFCDEL
ncbi:hypothetical protein B0H34DRAFT_783885 [Crassisporium funariophilum]|nr:hypothetical protein B0H34DRAFT_783885 [Crassisporium funariophilum]